MVEVIAMGDPVEENNTQTETNTPTRNLKDVTQIDVMEQAEEGDTILGVRGGRAVRLPADGLGGKSTIYTIVDGGSPVAASEDALDEQASVAPNYVLAENPTVEELRAALLGGNVMFAKQESGGTAYTNSYAFGEDGIAIYLKINLFDTINIVVGE